MPDSRQRETGPDGRVAAWDAAVRVFHWSLALLVLADFWLDDGGWAHRAIGYGAAGIVVARWAWEVLARGARGLATLLPSLRGTLSYLRLGLPRSPGHDPLGLWMVWLLWSLVLALGVTGWMSRLDAYWGDDGIRAVHAAIADALMVAVAVHLSGVVAMSVRWRENLVAAMLTGRKRPIDRTE